MKQKRQHFVFNKISDYQRGFGSNIRLTGSGITLADSSKRGIFWSRLLDSREKETIWHRLRTEGRLMQGVRLTIYCGDEAIIFFGDSEQSLGTLLSNKAFGDEERQQFSGAFEQKTITEPSDLLLHDLMGQYLWFRLELLPQIGEPPVLDNLTIEFPRQTWLSYLPEIYQAEESGASFTGRFLGIFQSLYDDLDQEIRTVSRYFDPDVAEGAYLEWLAGWLDTEDRYLWQEDKLRRLIKEGMHLYRIRGTRGYLSEMVRIYTGYTPYIVEYSGVRPFLQDAEQASLLRELYGEHPYLVTLILDEQAVPGSEEHRALLRIIENAKPAWIEANLVVLKPYTFLDKYTYLGMNSMLDRYRPMRLDGHAALPFTGLHGGGAQEI